jgi:sugar phosphate isomerase/epimerase
MKIAFNTANLVARVNGYRFGDKQWGELHQATVKATDEKEFAAICALIASKGFDAVELWQAHADPSVMTEAKASTWTTILSDHGLKAIAYAGGPTPGVYDVCGWLGIPRIVGGLWGTDLDTASRLCASTGILYDYENHPEKSAQEMRSKIAGSDPALIGLGVDLGWMGTNYMDGPAVLRELGTLVRHVHVKDVSALGGHSTAPIGSGVVDVAACLAVLKARGYLGWYSWEDEPEDRNPFDVAVQSREFILAHG